MAMMKKTTTKTTAKPTSRANAPQLKQAAKSARGPAKPAARSKTSATGTQETTGREDPRVSQPNNRQTGKDQRKQAVIDILNKARSMELYSINQYMNQHYVLDDKDYGKLAANIKLIAIDEMRHAEEFAERIKELDGEPTHELSGMVHKGQQVKEVFPFDSNLEDGTIDIYNDFLKQCRELGDSVSATLLENIIKEEQDHLNYFQNEADHIDTLGASYLSKIAGTSSTVESTLGFVKAESGATSAS